VTLPALNIQKLSKRYRIGARSNSYDTLRDSIANCFSKCFRSLRSCSSHGSDRGIDSFWALQDVTFAVQQGEVVGLVGRNGAGKSTLLKILSRITSPTEGYADVHGRVRSLLEVGTGFHPELTGRENICLNGAILGMKRVEIEHKFDEIVAFAEVERFVDTPVKRYSSGMYLRLAFAVAAHLSSEVLLVDEVLAVGDAAFQRKCLGKMGEVARQGRTVLFVSHNLAAVRSLCSRGVVLEKGRVAYIGEVERALFHYTKSVAGFERQTDRSGFTHPCINGCNPGTIASGDPFEVGCTIHVTAGLASFRLFCIVQDANGEAILVTPAKQKDLPLAEPGSYEVKVSFPELWLRPGVYSAHFKLLANSAAGTEGRFISEGVMLDVLGTDDPEMLLGSLAPPARWCADRVALANC
jgi:lipopolysaccharide transport system ATP-binding protein